MNLIDYKVKHIIKDKSIIFIFKWKITCYQKDESTNSYNLTNELAFVLKSNIFTSTFQHNYLKLS